MGNTEVVHHKSNYQVDTEYALEREKMKFDQGQRMKRDESARQQQDAVALQGMKRAESAKQAQDAEDLMDRQHAEARHEIQLRREKADAETQKVLMDVDRMSEEVKYTVDQEWARDQDEWDKPDMVNFVKASHHACITYSELSDVSVIEDHVAKLVAGLPDNAKKEMTKMVKGVVDIIRDSRSSVLEAVDARVETTSFNAELQNGEKTNFNTRYAVAFRFNRVSADTAKRLGIFQRFFGSKNDGDEEDGTMLVAIGYIFEVKTKEFVVGGVSSENRQSALGFI